MLIWNYLIYGLWLFFLVGFNFKDEVKVMREGFIVRQEKICNFLNFLKMVDKDVVNQRYLGIFCGVVLKFINY